MKDIVKPLGNRVLIKKDEAETKTAGGVILTDAKESDRATVLEVGDEVKELYKGDRIIFKTYDPYEINKEEGIIIIREPDAICVL